MIDVNHYVNDEAKTSALRHRGLGLGVQGLADVFMMLHFPFDSSEARELNKDIFEAIYFASLEASNELAQQHGVYPSYEGSPASQGVLQHDLWEVSGKLDWTSLRASIKQHGLRNSVLIAPMPTTTTSQFLGNNDGIEPYQSMMFTHRSATGECHAVNPHLLKALIERGMWNAKVKELLMQANGSIQSLPLISDDIKKTYKTVWEISQRVLIDMAVDRAAFIDQSQSLNLFSADPNYSRLSSMHFYSWKKGLKTGMQFLRSSPLQSMRLTMDEEPKEMDEEVEGVTDGMAAIACSLENPEACVSCSG
jgi:ribonucleoside-diphosphate reductase subunit M1